MGYANNLAVQLPNLSLVNEEMSQVIPSIKSVGKRTAMISDVQSISLENISFNYPGEDEPVIKSFSETFAAGTFNVICGPSGVGKSTLLDLVSHLVLPKSGSVKYNGENIEALNEENLRGLIAYSSQEAFVFRGSLEENITLGSRFKSDLFERTIELCQIQDLVQIGDGGQRGRDQISRNSLSGGQKQRVSLARSIYRRPQVLLLDEPTSAVDESLEKKIIDGVRNYTKSESIITIMVSHNPAHHEQADKLVRL
jgi:ABC-type bacteriocin/lantibiotic exporter with double-glycine peptidase domain